MKTRERIEFAICLALAASSVWVDFPRPLAALGWFVAASLYFRK
jgi:hypothetical protein